MTGLQTELVSIKTLSTLLDLPEWTIRKWVSKKKIRYHKLGKLIRFDLKEIRCWYKANTIEPVKQDIINDPKIQK